MPVGTKIECVFKGGPIDGYMKTSRKLPSRFFVAVGQGKDVLEMTVFLYSSDRDFIKAKHPEGTGMHIYKHMVPPTGSSPNPAAIPAYYAYVETV